MLHLSALRRPAIIAIGILVLSLNYLNGVSAQSSTATCTNGTKSEINIGFDDNYPRYTGPGPQVKRWSSDGLPPGTTGSNILDDYIVPEAVMKSVVPWVVVFSLFTTGLLCFFCCRCCCGKCHIKEPSSRLELLLLFLVLCLLLISLIFIGVGLRADDDQSDFLTGLPGVVDSFTNLTTNITGSVANVGRALNDTLNVLDEAIDDIGGRGTSSDLDDLRDDLATLRDPLNDIDDIAESVSFGELSSVFGDEIEDYDKQRSRAFRTVFGILCGMVILTAIISLCNAKGPDGLRPKQHCCCRFLSGVVKVITFVTFIVLWLLTAFLILLARTTSDTCVDFDANLLSLAEISVSQTTERYFIQCDDDEQLRDCQNPFVSEINSLDSTLDTAINAWTSFRDANNSPCDASGSAPVKINCTPLDTSINSLRSSVDSLVGNVLGCRPLNSLYQNIALLLCSDFGESLGTTTNLLVGFSIIFFFTEILTRLLADGDPDGDGTEYAGSNKVA